MGIAKPWKGRRVLVTGHTGFKGGWLCLWLQGLGADVHGLALDPPTDPNLFSAAGISGVLTSDQRVDIRDHSALCDALGRVMPDVVYHLAAQPLVNHSYNFPVETYAVNVLGTAHILDAIGACSSVRAAVIVTTDKCYENREWIHPYRETDRLGGRDPYSSSKACAELVTAAWRTSFFSGSGRDVRVASARAGNVIGGGDWADARLVPDFVRAFRAGRSVALRYPSAVRPWQHVLEPVAGYALLADRLLAEDGAAFAEGWNFGPEVEDSQPVGVVADQVATLFGVKVEMPEAPAAWHEAGLLRLDSTKAKERLGWRPRWPLGRAIAETVDWYTHWARGEDMLAFSCGQIDSYRFGSANG